MKRAIVLLSGGIDSATTLFLAKKKGFRPQSLIFDYGQRHRKEIEFAKKLAKRARSPYKILKLSFPQKSTSLVGRKREIPLRRSLKEIKKRIPSTYVPARNLVFLSIAASFAESMAARAVFIGAHTEDYSGYPDCRKEFFTVFKKAITAGTKDGKNLRIYAPLVNKNKKEIIKLGIKLKVPFEFTWSCYTGGKKPCGVCDSCFFRKKAFKELGINDPYFKEK
ncbi:MAG: 7-cyano-7-deazaguanine synthase QueC [Candidatus Omnitrophica bacterium]|nr:7-cyano-7-deazaguanine synthase QueC [Candidatus Omnitrophota bacterium]